MVILRLKNEQKEKQQKNYIRLIQIQILDLLRSAREEFREKQMERERQTDRHTDIHTQTDRQTDRHKYRQKQNDR